MKPTTKLDFDYAHRKAELIYNKILAHKLPRKVFIEPTGAVRSFSLAAESGMRLQYLVGVYDERTSARHIADDLLFWHPYVAEQATPV